MMWGSLALVVLLLLAARRETGDPSGTVSIGEWWEFPRGAEEGDRWRSPDGREWVFTEAEWWELP